MYKTLGVCSKKEKEKKMEKFFWENERGGSLLSSTAVNSWGFFFFSNQVGVAVRLTQRLHINTVTAFTLLLCFFISQSPTFIWWFETRGFILVVFTWQVDEFNSLDAFCNFCFSRSLISRPGKWTKYFNHKVNIFYRMCLIINHTLLKMYLFYQMHVEVSVVFVAICFIYLFFS